MSTKITEKPDAAAEYEDVPVPAAARRSLLSVAAVWAGFPMCLGNAVFGGLIVYSQGMIRGLCAIVLIMAVIALGYGLRHGGRSISAVWHYSGTGHTLGFWACVGIVVAGFANSIAFLIGGLVVAVGGAANPASDGGSFLGLLTGHGPVLTCVSVLFVFANLGSVAAHSLYNGAVGWSGITPLRMWRLAVLLGLAGAVIVLTGVWGHIVNWLELLGVIVPPIGAVLIVDRLLGRGREGTAAEFRPTAFAAWTIGAVAAAVAHYELPGSVDAVIGFVVAVLVQGVLMRVFATPRSAAPVAVPV